MIALHINELVNLLPAFLGREVGVAVLIGGPRTEVGRRALAVTANLVEGRHDTDRHVVNTPFGNSAVQYTNSQVGTEVRHTVSKGNITGHRHVQTSERRFDTAVMRLPVGHNKTLEAKLVLEQLVQEMTVLAGVAVVDLVVGAHDCTYTCTNRISKRPQVHLVHGLVIDVGAGSLGDVVPIADGFGDLSEVLLFVGDVVLSSCNDTGILNTLDCFGHKHTRQGRIRREAFPVPTAFGRSTQRTSDGAQLDVNALVAEFLTHCLAAEVGKLPIPGCADVKTGGECRGVVT